MTQKKSLPKVAYFCMEYAIESSMKTYAGGLGILAGDYIKGAKDHEFPIIGIGIKWKQGYGTQEIDSKGKPYDSYYNQEYENLIDTKIIVKVKIRGIEIGCKVWKVKKNSVDNLYLLDTDFPNNPDSWITGQLYGWFGEERVAQEMILGIGGVRALRALGHKIDVYHFNEGHAFFAGIELINEKKQKGMSFEKALEETRKEVVFTTHTPIIQGNESHSIERILYMGANGDLTIDELNTIGGSPFNMTVAALRISKISNAVAQLHKETANEMWKEYKNCANIIGITNAIHIPTWVDKNILDSLKNPLKLWASHQENKKKLFSFIEKRNGIKLDLNKLTIGFARRAVAYKRSNLIFNNSKFITPLLQSGKIQIVFSGKAHPLDDAGKKIVQELVSMSNKFPNSIIFLKDYDMEIGSLLTRGADIWLNNPRRPQEASGTSGMKAAMNGVLNCSILDGWWPEVCNHGINGWQFGNGVGLDKLSSDKLDKHDADALEKVLINEVIPTYYNNNTKWIEMMQQSIISTKEEFSIKRMLTEYFKLLYTYKTTFKNA